jgi:flagellar protein FliS
MMPANRQNEYVSLRVLTASPMQLVRILYETGVQAVDKAIEAQHSGDVIERGRAVSKAFEVLAELQASLRHDVQEEYSKTLAGLYSYMQRQLMRAHAEQSLSLLNEVSRLLNTLMEGWVGAMEQMESGRVPDRSVNAPEPDTVFSAPNPYSGDPVHSGSECRSWQL